MESHSRLVPVHLLVAVGVIALLLLGKTSFSTQQLAGGDGSSGISFLRFPTVPSCTPTQPPPTCNSTTVYIASELEQAWMTNVAKWEQSFCGRLQPLDNSTKVWLDTIAELSAMQQQEYGGKSPAQVLAEQGRMDPRVFSRWRTTYDCGSGSTTEQTTWIEPLSHGLRHPNALCRRGADLMDRGYLLLAHGAEHAAASRLNHTKCQGRDCQHIYFDLGATTLQPGPKEAGQGWFFDAYKRQGVVFDRFFMWEAKPQPPENIYRHVPKADLHRYTYFNIPASGDIKDASNPVNMLKAIAQPGDFVVFKLDIDNFAVEHAILGALKADPAAMALVDEFFFEEHVKFKEMLVHWQGSVGPDTSLASSFALFHGLRQQGLRAHSWV